MAKKVSGVFAPITTPFIDDAVAFDQFKENIKKYGQTPLNGYLVLGSNGEQEPDRRREIATAGDRAAGKSGSPTGHGRNRI
jgi:dihydrodipicolinate synthase/N-acetylneuraminate lyase